MIEARMGWLGAAVAGLMLLSACASDGVVKPPDEEVRSEQTNAILKSVLAHAEPGDWLVSRGYKASDHLVAMATNTPLSHAALLDLERGTVIEADAHGIHATPIRDFIHHAHRVLLLRPLWANAQSRPVAVATARALLGKEYDFLGTIGLNDPQKFYCSELTVYAYRQFHTENDKLPVVVEPGQLYLWGSVLYDSRPRS